MNKNKDLLDSFNQYYCHWCQVAVDMNMLCGPIDPLKRFNIEDKTIYYCENCLAKYEIVDNNLCRIYYRKDITNEIKKILNEK